MNNTFPDFDHRAEELWAFICSTDVFIIVLADKSPVLFVPEDTDAFCQWLHSNGIRDVRTEIAQLQKRVGA